MPAGWSWRTRDRAGGRSQTATYCGGGGAAVVRDVEKASGDQEDERKRIAAEVS
jgi:hypothetical protein